ncbi:hypothetical protein DW182_00250 [Bacteroides sp. AM16-24]|uniref:hypothetical protein n=1 Tax=Bacteroides sp. AM16-24 TaxID=2292002 RepID=UPI000E4B4577|nr:hypothetical protein [Bacteroides sp. AM16-24]RHI12594.1 hypothetical protein DW182_00250 [Bacteroides sp. AM16-24]
MKIYVFNPDTDMALANNEENYIAPASVRRMAQDLALLPIWYAQPGSAVLAPSAYNADYLQMMKRMFTLPVQLVTEPELPDYAESQIMPWGWNLAFRRRMLKGGIAEHKLFTTEELGILRVFSSRAWAMTMLDFFYGIEDCCGSARYLNDLSACREFVEEYKRTVLKAPWSSSGKGLNWCRGTFTDSIAGWCQHVLDEQGGVIGQPEYNKVEDFALEFYSDGCGKVLFTGYSLFRTNEKGAYLGNRLVTAEWVEKWITDYLPLVTLIQVRERLQEVLTVIFGEVYTGYLGVDMMICRDEETQSFRIHPCVEINMRMNMGVVAHLFRENFVAPGTDGNFNIDYYPTNDALQEEHKLAMERYPAVIENGRLVSGYLPLVPVTPKSQYRAYVLCYKSGVDDTND